MANVSLYAMPTRVDSRTVVLSYGNGIDMLLWPAGIDRSAKASLAWLHRTLHLTNRSFQTPLYSQPSVYEL